MPGKAGAGARAMLAEAMGRWMRLIEQAERAEIRRMLGEWVSECEPQLVYGPEGIAGLAVAGERHWDGLDPIVVHAQPVEIPITDGSEVVGSHAVAMPLAEVRRRRESRARSERPIYLSGWRRG